MLEIVILLIVIILLLCLTFTYTSKLNGGEFVAAHSRSRTVVPSVSQIKLIKRNKFPDLLKESKETLQNMNEVSYQGEIYKIEKFDKAKYVSDACIDMIGINDKNKIMNGIGVCEYNMKSKSFGNNLATVIDKYSMSIHKKEHGSIPSMRPNRNDVFLFIDFVYPENGFIDITDAYEKIHRKTVEVINRFIDTHHKKTQVYRFTIEHENHKDVIRPCEILYIGNMIEVYGYVNEKHFRRLIIPSTSAREGLNYDEYLSFECKDEEARKTNLIHYNVNIEHSEGYDRHKTNLLEFLLRIARIKQIHINEIRRVLDAYGFERIGMKYKSSVKYNNDGRIVEYSNTSVNKTEIEDDMRSTAFYVANSDMFEELIILNEH